MRLRPIDPNAPVSIWSIAAAKALENSFFGCRTIINSREEERRCDSRFDSARFDSNATLILQQELAKIETRLFEAVYANLKAREIIAPGDEGIPPGAETFIWPRTEYRGIARIVGNGATSLPRITAFNDPTTWAVRLIAAEYGYSIDDLAAAAMSGRPLELSLATGARRACETLLDEIAALGSSADGIASGFANNATCTTNKIDAGANWTLVATDPNVIIGDIGTLLQKVKAQSGEKFEATDVVMSLDLWSKSMARVHTYQGKTVLSLVKEAFPGINFHSWNRLDTVASGSKPLVIAYQKDPAIASLAVPEEFNQLPPQVESFMFTVPCRLKTAGCMVKQPLGMAYMLAAGG